LDAAYLSKSGALAHRTPKRWRDFEISLPFRAVEQPEPKPPWPHAPTHRLGEAGTFMVTAGTYLKEHFFRGSKRLDYLQDRLLQFVGETGWRLEAWAVFSNHYHFVAHSPGDAESAGSLGEMIHRLHNRTSEYLNKVDGAVGRKVWHNFWETKLTFHNSYLSRLRYVHENAVKHGLVAKASLYTWCSAGWLERTASAAMVKALVRFRIDAVKVQDDFEPVLGGE
jgi:putative transposase